MNETIEKDVDLSTDRDASRALGVTSLTGSDDKSKTFDTRVDVGEAEAVAASLANVQGVGANLIQLAVSQQIRHAEELFGQRMRLQEELAAIRQRQIGNSADYDQDVRELRVTHNRDRHSQDVRHADLAIDRQWNLDEQIYGVVKVLEGLGVGNRIAYATVLASLADVLRAQAA